MKPLTLWVAILLLTGTATAIGSIINNPPEHQLAPGRETHVLKILTALENKIENPQLLERTREKLQSLSERQTRLIASLSDRVIKEGNSAGASIALLLMTVLITLL